MAINTFATSSGSGGNGGGGGTTYDDTALKNRLDDLELEGAHGIDKVLVKDEQLKADRQIELNNNVFQIIDANNTSTNFLISQNGLVNAGGDAVSRGIITLNNNGVSIQGTGTSTLAINGDAGTKGQVLKSTGSSSMPAWDDGATFEANTSNSVVRTVTPFIEDVRNIVVNQIYNTGLNFNDADYLMIQFGDSSSSALWKEANIDLKACKNDHNNRVLIQSFNNAYVRFEITDYSSGTFKITHYEGRNMSIRGYYTGKDVLAQDYNHKDDKVFDLYSYQEYSGYSSPIDVGDAFDQEFVSISLGIDSTDATHHGAVMANIVLRTKDVKATNHFYVWIFHAEYVAYRLNGTELSLASSLSVNPSRVYIKSISAYNTVPLKDAVKPIKCISQHRPISNITTRDNDKVNLDMDLTAIDMLEITLAEVEASIVGVTAILGNYRIELINFDFTKLIHLHARQDTYVMRIDDAEKGLITVTAAVENRSMALVKTAGFIIDDSNKKVEKNTGTAISELSANDFNQLTRIRSLENSFSNINDVKVYLLKDVVSLVGGWNVHNPDWQPILYKHHNKYIHIKGLIKGGALNTNVCTLPVGYRPRQKIQMSACMRQGGVVVRLDLLSNGILKVTNETTNSPAFSTGMWVDIDFWYLAV